jgi:putative inorganic carbon (HCO3(-)) transporter
LGWYSREQERIDRLSMGLIQWIGIGLVGLGVVWESLLAPSLIGWGFILVGFLALLLPGRRWPARTPLDWSLLLLAAMSGVSLLITARPEITQVQAARLWAGLAVCYGVIQWIAGQRSRALVAAVALVVVAVALALLAPFTVGWNLTKAVFIPSSVYEHFPLLIADPIHPNVIASLLALLFPLPLAWLLASGGVEPGRSSRWRVVLHLASGMTCLLIGLTLVLTKSRGGYISGAVGGLATVWLSARGRWGRALALLLTLAVIGAAAYLFFGSSPDNFAVTGELVEGATDPSTWAFRQQVWRTALWMIADFPFTGVGMGLFNEVGALLYPFYETANPGAHNLYLQIGVDLGLPGLIAYLALVMLTIEQAVSARKAFIRRRDVVLHTVTNGVLAGWVAVTVHGLVDITVWGTRAAFIPWVVIGLAAALHRVAEEQASQGVVDKSRA